MSFDLRRASKEELDQLNALNPRRQRPGNEKGNPTGQDYGAGLPTDGQTKATLPMTGEQLDLPL